MPRPTALDAVQVMPRPAVDPECDPLPPWRLQGVEPLRVVAHELFKLVNSDLLGVVQQFAFLRAIHLHESERCCDFAHQSGRFMLGPPSLLGSTDPNHEDRHRTDRLSC